MRRIALLGTTLALSACSGFDTFFHDTHWFGNPNKVLGNSENLRRVRGQFTPEQALRPEPGNVWPGPIPPEPTLQELMREENLQIQRPLPPALPVPAEPTMPGPGGPKSGAMPPNPLETNPQPPISNAPPVPSKPGKPVAPPRGGHTYQTPEGPQTGIPGPGGYETLVSPKGGPGGIVVPNGNGTSTIIMPDGKVLTVPTPK
jgi:hypothetical protein